MTMDELVTDFTVLLRAALAVPVEAYQRLEPPTEQRVMVLEGNDGESGEWARDLDAVAGGTSYSRMGLQIMVEIPWDEKAATVTAIDDTREAIKLVIKANRDITADDGVHAAVGRDDGATPFMTTYPGHPNTWIKGRSILASWRV